MFNWSYPALILDRYAPGIFTAVLEYLKTCHFDGGIISENCFLFSVTV